MAFLRQTSEQVIAVPLDLERTFALCLGCAGKIGRITRQLPELHCLSLQTPITILPVIANPVTLTVSVEPAQGGSRIRFSGESPDGAVGIGSVDKVIARFEKALQAAMKA